MKRLSYLLLTVLLGSLMISWNPPAKTKKKSAPEIKNIIFMIGDGMGLSAYAFGPGAEKFTGIYDNTDFITKFLSCYKFEK